LTGKPIFKRLPSKRALAALAKLHGYRLEKRWPFLIRAEGKDLNLTFEDVLEFQYTRSRRFLFVTIGAFDGLANDPVGRFVRNHDCHGILLEPQPGAYARLCANYRGFPQCKLLNAAIDEVSGSRTLYFVPAGIPGLPDWTEQIASFQREHVVKHEAEALGLTACIQSQDILTISFNDLLDLYQLHAIDVLQIDAEGMDGQLLTWFPFERLKPGVLHYETTHLSSDELRAVRNRLKGFGYFVREADAPSDDMAVLL
jgi:FkbM family methyltransferase